MLILAGVSINAIVGDNGVLTKTTYASFLSEMSAVEEAVQMWKAGEIIEAQGDEVKAIPANGLCRANDLTSAERLVGEVGYYRVWSLTSTMPTIDILSSADKFNDDFEDELVYYPRGVEDLYYLDNEKLELDSNKKYLIDAATGIIYSMSGISIKGVRCYSSYMAKSIMNGINDIPLFASAEISGDGSNIVYAGATYLMDKNGNYIDAEGNIVDEAQKILNPYGFKILADYSSSNIYKLYNNGELYAKGLKGMQINSSKEEIESIDNNKWLTSNLPEEIPGITTGEASIYIGYQEIMVIDKNKKLWAWGVNTSNRFGFSNEELIEFSQYNIYQLDINNENIVKVFPLSWATFVITESGKLYASGNNEYGKLGIGTTSEIGTSPQTNKFFEVQFPEEISNIKDIHDGYIGGGNAQCYSFISTKTGNVYFAGRRIAGGKAGNIKLIGVEDSVSEIKTWTKINIETMFPELVGQVITVSNQNWVWSSGIIFFYSGNICYQMNPNGSTTLINPWGACSNIKMNVYYSTVPIAFAEITKINNGIESKEYWIYENANYCTVFGVKGASGWVNCTNKFSQFEYPIESYYYCGTGFLVKLTNNDCYGIGNMSNFGHKELGVQTNWVKIDELSNMKSRFSLPSPAGSLVFLDSNNQLTGCGCDFLIKRSDLLVNSWRLIDTDVAYFSPRIDKFSYAVVKNDENGIGHLYVKGITSDYLGLNIRGKSIYELTEITGEGANDEVKEALASGIKKYFIQNYRLYILTNNGVLLMSNYEDLCSNTSKGVNGLGTTTNYPYLVKVTDKLKNFDVWGANLFAQKNDEEGSVLFANSNQQGYGIGHASVLTKGNSSWNTAGNWYTVIQGAGAWFIGDKKVLACGTWGGKADNNGNRITVSGFQELSTPESMILGAYTESAIFVLSSSKKVYAVGSSQYLGRGILRKDEDVPVLDNVFDKELVDNVCCGNGFAIITTSNGKVYATGKNETGVLGRWIGTDRNEKNSRYRRAYDWVECPELEI